MPKASYLELISQMMFAFGDNPTPNPESVKLVESIVLKQLRDILYEAGKHADHRDSQTIEPEDVIFLIRQERHKMHRFVKYLNYKYNEVPKVQNTDVEFVASRKKYKRILDFIKSIDETGELLNLDEYDAVKEERMIRSERISSFLDEEKYREYATARQASFVSKHYSNPSKFRDWVDPQQELYLTPIIVEILETFAYGIVGHIVDMALVVRQNSRQKQGDAVSSLVGSFYNPAMFKAPHLPYSKMSVTLGQSPISVREIQEVIRRCYMPQVGHVKFGYQSLHTKRKSFLY